jgi:hypothetical protein
VCIHVAWQRRRARGSDSSGTETIGVTPVTPARGMSALGWGPLAQSQVTWHRRYPSSFRAASSVNPSDPGDPRQRRCPGAGPRCVPRVISIRFDMTVDRTSRCAAPRVDGVTHGWAGFGRCTPASPRGRRPSPGTGCGPRMSVRFHLGYTMNSRLATTASRWRPCRPRPCGSRGAGVTTAAYRDVAGPRVTGSPSGAGMGGGCRGDMQDTHQRLQPP